METHDLWYSIPLDVGTDSVQAVHKQKGTAITVILEFAWMFLIIF